MDQAEHLRNVIKVSEQKLNARMFTITSGKGGVGKSSAAVNMAVWFRQMGYKVIILDADFGLANVEIMFGTVPRYTLSDFIYKGRDLKEIITEGPMGIGFISGGSGIVGLNNIDNAKIKILIDSLAQLNDLCDILIIDTGAGISDQVMKFVLNAPDIILVVTPDPSSISDSYAQLKTLYSDPSFMRNDTRIRLLANKVNSADEGLQLYQKLDSIVHRFLGGGMYYLGYIPTDPVMEKTIRAQRVVSISNPNARSSRGYKAAADALLNNNGMERMERRGVTELFRNIFGV